MKRRCPEPGQLVGSTQLIVFDYIDEVYYYLYIFNPSVFLAENKDSAEAKRMSYC